MYIQARLNKDFILSQPKRKRAFHRALKRNEDWAIRLQRMRELFKKRFIKEITAPLPFQDLLKKDGQAIGETVKISYGLQFDKEEK